MNLNDAGCATSSFVTEQPFGVSAWIAGRQMVSPKLSVPSHQRVTQATVSVTGLGFYELRLNGAKVGTAELDPGFSTNYTSRVLYATFDVTAEVAAAAASSDHGVVLAALVGAGKYSMAVSASDVFIPGRSVFAFRAELSVTYADGSTDSLMTNKLWSVYETPAIVAEHLYHGEVYDARLEVSGWDRPGFDPVATSLWKPAVEIQPLAAQVILSPRLFPPIRVVDEVVPVTTTQLNATSWSFDFGNNFAGTAQIVLPSSGAPAGHIMTLVHTEYPKIATSPGTPDTYNQQDTYIFSGKEPAGHTYRATFVYHGYRYVRVDGYPAGAGRPVVTALFMHSAVTSHGNVTFDTATPAGRILSAVHGAVVQSQACNLYSHPTVRVV
jgi:alpha-L-rhamnosidase